MMCGLSYTPENVFTAHNILAFSLEQVNLKKIHQYRSDHANFHNLKDVVLCVLFDCFYCVAEQSW